MLIYRAKFKKKSFRAEPPRHSPQQLSSKVAQYRVPPLQDFLAMGLDPTLCQRLFSKLKLLLRIAAEHGYLSAFCDMNTMKYVLIYVFL